MYTIENNDGIVYILDIISDVLASFPSGDTMMPIKLKNFSSTVINEFR